MLACMITPGAGEPGGAATVKRPARPLGGMVRPNGYIAAHVLFFFQHPVPPTQAHANRLKNQFDLTQSRKAAKKSRK